MKFLILLFSLLSCSKFVQLTDDQYYEVIDTKGNTHIDIMFSHNINGETHPCGCRQFPLGGMAQTYGIIASNSKKNPTIYIDTGDTFFETTIIPDFIKQSSEFKAKKIAEALDKLGLKIYTPGDQDFSLGEKFLIDISNKHKFKFLISNSSKKMKIKHQKLIRIDSNGTALFFIGVISPELLRNEYKELLVSPEESIKKQIQIINQKFSDVKNKKIILLSHSGIEYDKHLAEKFKDIEWIIGSHSQSFLRYSVDAGNAQIVQVLSRNHHLGKVSLALSKKAKDKYEIIEVRDETKDLVKNNIMLTWLNQFKSDLDKVHSTEQAGQQGFETDKRLPTYISCSQCHEKQVDFWQGTTHSMAYSTLLNANEAKNPSCIKCHSVGHNQEGGFSSQRNMIISEKESFNYKEYWNEFVKDINVKHPLRKQSSKYIRKIAKKSLKRDAKNQVTHNFSNVQCINCHDKLSEHPFDEDNEKVKPNFQAKCITCHTNDQSPEWYNKDVKGLATSLNQKYFAKKLKEVSCPKIE